MGKIALIAYLSFLMAALIAHCAWPTINLHFEDTGRLEAWKGLLCDFINPKFPGVDRGYILTGHGLGSFSVLFPFFHHSPFHQAHNELLELFYATGLSGLIITFFVLKDVLIPATLNPITLGLLGISICAMTNAVWHVPQLAFLTVLLLGLFYNKTIQEKTYVA